MQVNIEKAFEIEEPIDKVWALLSNPEKVVNCVPSAEITEKIDDRTYKGKIGVKVGPIGVKYNADIQIKELDNENKKMVLESKATDSKGKGGANMLMNGVAVEADGKCTVSFKMDVSISGLIAQFGSRVVNDVSNMLFNKFVKSFKAELEKQ